MVGVGRAARESAQGLLALFFHLFLWEGGIHEHIGHDVQQSFAVLDQAAAIHAKARCAKAGANAVNGFVNFGFGACGSPCAHEGACHAGVSSACAFENGVDVQTQTIAHAGKLVVFDHNQSESIFQFFYSVVTEHNLGCRSRSRSLGSVNLTMTGQGHQADEDQKEGGNAVHCAFSLRK